MTCWNQMPFKIYFLQQPNNLKRRKNKKKCRSMTPMRSIIIWNQKAMWVSKSLVPHNWFHRNKIENCISSTSSKKPKDQWIDMSQIGSQSHLKLVYSLHCSPLWPLIAKIILAIWRKLLKFDYIYMDKPTLIITTLKNGDRLTFPKKGNHVRIHF